MACGQLFYNHWKYETKLTYIGETETELTYKLSPYIYIFKLLLLKETKYIKVSKALTSIFRNTRLFKIKLEHTESRD